MNWIIDRAKETSTKNAVAAVMALCATMFPAYAGVFAAVGGLFAAVAAVQKG